MLEDSRRNSATKSSKTSRYLYEFSNLYSDKTDYVKSGEFYLKYLKILEEILPPNHPHMAAIYMNLASIYSDKTDYEKSEEFSMKYWKIKNNKA